MTFGVPPTEASAITSNELASMLKSNEPKEVKVKGQVVEVCKAEGCWLRMNTSAGTMMIRMKDHKFFIPVSMQGKTIVADGTATLKETSVGMLRHFA